MPDKVLTIDAAAALLTRAVNAHAGEQPAFKIRGQSRIKRAELAKRIDAQPPARDGGRRGE